MATTITPNVPNAIKALQEQLNADMLAQAEPLIKEALAKIEKEMRARLAQRLIANIQQDMDVRTMGHTITITLRQATGDHYLTNSQPQR